MMKKRIIIFAIAVFSCLTLVACGSSKKGGDSKKTVEKPFSFSDVTWDTKRDEIIDVVGKKPSEEGETQTGGYSYYFIDEQFEGYKVELNYVYENDSLNSVVIVFRDVTEADYNKLEKTFNDKYGDFKESGSSKTWNAGTFDVVLDNTPLGFGMLKVEYDRH